MSNVRALALATLLALVPLRANAQALQSVNINRAKLTWTWAVGDGGAADYFNMKCGTAPGSYTRITRVNAPTTELSVAQAIAGSGTWYCVVTAVNQFGESGPSNELPFVAGAAPSTPGNLTVQ